MVNFRVVGNLLGVMVTILGMLMLTVIPFSIYYRSGDAYVLLGCGIGTYLTGLFFWKFRNKNGNGDNPVQKRDAFMVVALAWIIMSLFGSLPYVFSGQIPNFSDAFFEAASGFTTTGASILNNIEIIPKGILLWRSMTQWIGGMGIIVMTIAIMPMLGIGGMELFMKEYPGGPSSEKLHPRIKETAKRLWAIYFTLTVACALLLWWSGMSFFDSVNHAFTTLSTGGFSTRQASVGFTDSPTIHYIIILFMFIAGINFTLIYHGFKGRLNRFWNNDEFMAYCRIILGFAFGVTVVLLLQGYLNLEHTFRMGLFQVVAIVTSTGFVTADYTTWGTFLTLVFFGLMFIGACSGSTAGGVKVIRHLVLFKNCRTEFKRLLHPRAVIPVKINNNIVSPEVISNVLVFVLVYIFIFIFASIILASTGVDFETSIGAVAACLGNIGPGIGTVGPAGTYYHLSDMAKWLLSLIMIIGRLELFTILIIFTPYFWKKQ